VGTALSSVLLHGHVLDIVVMFLCAYGYTIQNRVLCMVSCCSSAFSIVTLNPGLPQSMHHHSSASQV
jgi:hypothetical protein